MVVVEGRDGNTFDTKRTSELYIYIFRYGDECR